MDEHFMEMLDSLRRGVGEPLKINSGWRCDIYDKSIRGDGNHPTGKAADIFCTDSTLRFKIIYYAITLGFKRIGIAKEFIHLDMVSEHPQQVIWFYS